MNNVLCFPGIFRGALDVRASDINDEMKIAAAYAIAGLVSDEELCADYILPAAFDSRVKDAVAKATAEAAIKSGVAGSKILYISVCFLLRRITLNDARCELPLNPFHARSKVFSQWASFFCEFKKQFCHIWLTVIRLHFS